MECLRELRKSKKLTMKELGKMVDVSESMIGLIEKGKRNPSYETLLKLTEVFDVSVDALINNKIPATIRDGQEENEENLLDVELLHRLTMLSPDELARVDAFVQGILASR